MNTINLTEIPAIYINLKKHKQKNENMYNMLTKIGFKNIKRVEGVLDDNNSVAGCSKAHHKVLSSFSTPFILFEDDCVFCGQYDQLKIKVPEDIDALYLGVSSWGRMNGHNGPYLQYDKSSDNLLKIYNMLGGHAIAYLSEEYKKMCERVSYHAGYIIKNYQDVGFAEVQKFFNVYSLATPMFYQTSNEIATKYNIHSYSSRECMEFDSLQFYPYKIK